METFQTDAVLSIQESTAGVVIKWFIRRKALLTQDLVAVLKIHESMQAFEVVLKAAVFVLRVNRNLRRRVLSFSLADRLDHRPQHLPRLTRIFDRFRNVGARALHFVDRHSHAAFVLTADGDHEVQRLGLNVRYNLRILAGSGCDVPPPRYHGRWSPG